MRFKFYSIVLVRSLIYWRSYGTSGSVVSCIRVLFQSIFAAIFVVLGGGGINYHGTIELR
jgi:hypothetical protein